LGATCHEFRSIILDDIDSVWRNLYKRWPKHHIKSIDEGDWRDEFTTRFTIQKLQRTGYTQSTSVIAHREAVINTIIAFHDQLKLYPDTLYSSVSIIERYMATKSKNDPEVRVVSLLWMAANVGQGRDTSNGDLNVDEFARIGSSATQEILDQEKQIRDVLEPNLTFPTIPVPKSILKPCGGIFYDEACGHILFGDDSNGEGFTEVWSLSGLCIGYHSSY